MTDDDVRADLAFRIVATLPGYGSWADSFRDFDTPYGKVGYRQLSILWALRFGLLPQHEFSPTRLAAFFRVQPSVATRALAKLESAGFITRAVDASDARVSHIAITEKGRDVSVFVERLFVNDVRDSIAGLTDDQIAELHRSMEILTAVLEDLQAKRERRTGRGAPSGR
jgi:DNA-binding MarR family transcriptional regulator